MADIFVGLQTSADEIYIIYADSEDNDFVYAHDKNQRALKLKSRFFAREFMTLKKLS